MAQSIKNPTPPPLKPPPAPAAHLLIAEFHPVQVQSTAASPAQLLHQYVCWVATPRAFTAERHSERVSRIVDLLELVGVIRIHNAAGEGLGEMTD